MGRTTVRPAPEHPGHAPRGPRSRPHSTLHLALGGLTFGIWASALGAAIGSEPEIPVEVGVVAAVPLEADFTWLDVDDVELAAEVPRAVPPARKAAPEVPTRAPERDAAGGTTLGEGRASWYGPGFAGRRTANGERFDPEGLTAAHRSLPMGTRIRVTNLANQRSVVVRVNDRGPFVRGRVLDVSQGAARELDMLRAGVANVKMEVVETP